MSLFAAFRILATRIKASGHWVWIWSIRDERRDGAVSGRTLNVMSLVPAWRRTTLGRSGRERLA